MTDMHYSPEESFLSRLRHRYMPVVLVAAVGVGFSVGVSMLIRSWEYRSIEKAFRLAAEDRATAVKNAFSTDVAMMELVRSSLISDGRVERQEFHETLAPFTARSRNIQAVEWVPRVPDAKRAEYEAAAQRDGIKGFHFRELDKNGDLVVAARREEYYPIYLIGPQVSNQAVFGFDLGSEKTRFESLAMARDTGNTVASGQFRFVQENMPIDGFMVCLPAYERGKPTGTVEERRKYLVGFIIGVFRPGDMIESALRWLQPEGIDVGLYDPSDKTNRNQFHFHASRTREGVAQKAERRELLDAGDMRHLVKLDIAGHPWTVVCVPSPDFVASRETWSPMAVLLAGLVFTGLLAGYLVMSINNTWYLEDRVKEQTADIRKTQEDVLYRLASAALYRNTDVGQHIRRIGVMSQVLARSVDWYGEELDSIRQAAPMLDIGKIGIPDAILRKTGELTAEELEIFQGHVRIGGEILSDSKIPMLRMARDIALHHHERWDGKGYPKGLAGKDIPESARIVAIVDAYDTLTHNDPNHRAMTDDEALVAMQQESGKQFDPVLLAAFLRRLSDYRQIADRFPDRRSANNGTSASTAAPIQVPSNAQAWSGPTANA